MRAQPVFWRTGDDYVDLGIDVLRALKALEFGNLPDNAALGGLPRAEDLYLQDAARGTEILKSLYPRTGWLKALASIWPNSVLVNASPPRGKTQAAAYAETLDELLDFLYSPAEVRDEVKGLSCWATGEPAQSWVDKRLLPLADRTNGPSMPGGVPGMPTSAAVALALHFSPLGLSSVVKKLKAYPVFDSPLLRDRYALEKAKRALSAYFFAGNEHALLGPKPVRARSRASAAANIVEHCISSEWLSQLEVSGHGAVSVVFFDNDNRAAAGGSGATYDMPGESVSFLVKTLKRDSALMRAWARVLADPYDPLEGDGGGKPRGMRENSRAVYQTLFGFRRSPRSIAVVHRCSNALASSRGDFSLACGGRADGSGLLEIYEREVNQMDQRRLDAIWHIAERVVDAERDPVEGTKLRDRLGSARSRGELLSILRKVLSSGYEDATEEGKDFSARAPVAAFDLHVAFAGGTGKGRAAQSDFEEARELLAYRVLERQLQNAADAEEADVIVNQRPAKTKPASGEGANGEELGEPDSGEPDAGEDVDIEEDTEMDPRGSTQ